MIRKTAIIAVVSLLGMVLNAQELFTLEKCKEMALENNAKSRNSRLSLEAAQQARKEAFTKYFPSISAMGMGFKTTDPMMAMTIPADLMAMVEMPPEAGNIDMLKKGMIGAVSAVQPVFAGGQIVTGNKLAKIGVEAEELQKTMSDDEVLLTVEQYYWQIIALEEKVKTIAEAANLLDRIHKDVDNAYKAGLTNKNDLLKVELKQNEMESNRLKVNNGLRLLKMTLAQYVGVPSEEFGIDKSFDGLVSSPANVRADHREALQQRAEYRLLDKNIEANKMQVKMKVGENLPSVAVGVGYNYFRFDKNDPMEMDNNFGMLFATVSVPISNWWGGSHAIKKQKLNVMIAENDKRNAEELLLIQMQQLWNELEEAWQQMLLAGKAIDSALENVRLNSDYYEAGTGLLSDLLDAQTSLQQARDQYTEAETGYRIKLSKYRQATVQ